MHLSKLLRVLWIQTAEPMVILNSADYEAAGGGPGPALSRQKSPDAIHTHEVDGLMSETTKVFGTD